MKQSRAFSISRIQTSKGIFRLSGYCDDNGLSNVDIHIEHLDIMGTDGWVSLQLEKSQALTDYILPDIKAHLNLEKV